MKSIKKYKINKEESKMDRDFELEEEFEEINYVLEHKTFPVKLKIVKREKYKPFFDFEEEFEEL